MPKKKREPFTPDPDFVERLRDYNGNRVNGLHETTSRRPSMVWWAPDPDTTVFGEAQKWFYAREQPDDEMLELRTRRREVVATELRLWRPTNRPEAPVSGPGNCSNSLTPATVK